MANYAIVWHFASKLGHNHYGSSQLVLWYALQFMFTKEFFVIFSFFLDLWKYWGNCDNTCQTFHMKCIFYPSIFWLIILANQRICTCMHSFKDVSKLGLSLSLDKLISRVCMYTLRDICNAGDVCILLTYQITITMYLFRIVKRLYQNIISYNHRCQPDYLYLTD